MSANLYPNLPPPPPSGSEPYPVKCDPDRMFTDVIDVEKPWIVDESGNSVPGSGYYVWLKWRRVEGQPFKIWHSEDDTSVLWNARFCKMTALYNPETRITMYTSDGDWLIEQGVLQEQRRREREARSMQHARDRRGRPARSYRASSQRPPSSTPSRSTQRTATRMSGNSTGGYSSGPFSPPSRHHHRRG